MRTGPTADFAHSVSFWKSLDAPHHDHTVAYKVRNFFEEAFGLIARRRYARFLFSGEIIVKRILLMLVAVAFVAPAWAGDAKSVPGIGPKGDIKKVKTGFKFTEGPAADGKGNVYFSDIPATTIHIIDKDGKFSVFTDKSNRANGLMFNAKGELLACEMAGQIVAYDVATKKKRVLTDKYDGKPYNAPNDLVVDRAGGVYFTDPDFGALKPAPQDGTAVYYVAPKGHVSRVTGNLPKPNGVILSPDEKTLYVIPSGSAEMLAHDVESPGKIGPGRVFCKLQQPKKGKGNSGGDGLTVDTKGNLYITSGLGLQVYSPKGKLLGIIAFPEQPANVTFGGPDNRTLFVTARTSLYTVEMEAQGHVFGK